MAIDFGILGVVLVLAGFTLSWDNKGYVVV